jgi:hypothetical protein
LNGGGYKTNHFDEETREDYWISGPRKDGQDTFYPGEVEIDDDVREEYWTEIRKQPGDAHLTSFRSRGRHAAFDPLSRLVGTHRACSSASRAQRATGGVDSAAGDTQKLGPECRQRWTRCCSHIPLALQREVR